MANAKATHIALAEDLCSRATLPLTSGVFLKVAHAVMVCSDRAKARTILRKMEAHRVDDIGVTMEELYLEARKPFWRA